MNEIQLKKQIHNLQQRKSRLKLKMQDPELYKKKRSERHKKYWASLPLEKKKKIIAKINKNNKQHRERTRLASRKYRAKLKLSRSFALEPRPKRLSVRAG